MTQKIVYLHRKDINNPGDWFSSPYHYFKDFEGEVIDLTEPARPITCDILIIGGGGLFSTNDWMHRLWLWTTRITAGKKVIWGAGIDEEFFNHPVLNDFDLKGFRQTNTPFDFVPCVSCLHTQLDTNIPSNKIASISGGTDHLIVGSGINKRTIPGQHMNNKSILSKPVGSFEKIINQIKIHNKITTASYHVWYWSKLLEKNVKIDYKSRYRKPLVEKFYTLPKVTNLKHYRELNLDFAKRVFTPG